MSDFKYHRPSNFPPIIKNLVIINVLVFVAQLVFENQYQLTDKLALYPIDTPQFKPYQVFTHMFTHSPDNIFHIVFNMLVLWMFGRILENVWGPKRFLTFYLLCGIGAAALHLLVQHLRYDQDMVDRLILAKLTNDEVTYNALIDHAGFLSPAVGASGAIMGIMAAFAYLFPNTPLMIIPIPFPIKAKWFVLGYVAYDLLGGFGYIGDRIAHFAHLGGALTGFLIVLFWNKNNRRTLY
jgi:membrane associated rhomboid family serine protease